MEKSGFNEENAEAATQREQALAKALAEGDSQALNELGAKFVKTERAEDRFDLDSEFEYLHRLEDSLEDENSALYDSYRFLPGFSSDFVDSVAESNEVSFLLLKDADTSYFSAKGQEMENFGQISPEITRRCMARQYYQELKLSEDDSERRHYQEQIKLLGVQPITNKEIEEEIRKIIERKWRSFQNK